MREKMMLKCKRTSISNIYTVLFVIAVLLTTVSCACPAVRFGVSAGFKQDTYPSSVFYLDDPQHPVGIFESVTDSIPPEAEGKDIPAVVREYEQIMDYSGILAQRIRPKASRFVSEQMSALPCPRLLTLETVGESLSDGRHISNLSSAIYVKATHKRE